MTLSHIVLKFSQPFQVRQILSDNGKAIASAVPSMPVQVIGWKSLPEAGEMLLEVESEVRRIVLRNYSSLYLKSLLK